MSSMTNEKGDFNALSRMMFGDVYFLLFSERILGMAKVKKPILWEIES